MKDYLLSRRFRLADIIIVALCFILGFVSLRFRVPVAEALNKESEISLGYIARKSEGLYYVIDNGHSRIVCFDEDGKIRFEIIDPTGETEYALYIDDVCVDKENIYLSASEWNGMLLDGEHILKYDLEGNYLETVAYNDYSAAPTTNKHRFYGINTQTGSLRYGECLADQIIIHEGDKVKTVNYPNAFNAVSDLVFDGEAMIVMNKDGRIESYKNNSEPELLYTTETEGEEERIPFRMCVNGNKVYFSDIRLQQIVEADPQSATSTVFYDGTDSQTITFADNGKEALLTNSDGLLVKGTSETTYLVLEKSDSTITTQYLFLASFALLVLVSIILLFRIIYNLRRTIITQATGFMIVLIFVVSVVCLIISFILLSSFRSNYRDKIKEQLESTALVVASAVNEDDINGINYASDFNSDAYNNLCSLMERSFPLNIDFYKTTYCNILRLDESGESGHGIAYLDQSIGVYFPLDEVEYAEVEEVYRTAQTVWDDTVEDVSGTYLSVKVPIINGNDKVVGVVAVGADTFVVDEMIEGMQRRVLLSIVVILLLISIIMTESIALVNAHREYLERKEKVGDKAIPVHMIRIMVFAVFTAFNLASSFLPVYILRRCDLFPEGSRELIASLPMTVNVFVMGIMSLFCAKMVRRFGVKKIFAAATLFSLVGNLIILLVPGYPAVAAGLLLDGIGVGLISNAIYVILAYINDENERQGCFSTYNSASLSGINFGMILGGLLATALGQRYVFLAVAIIWGLMLLLGIKLAKQFENIAISKEEKSEEKGNLTTLGFIARKVIWSFIVLIQNPYIVFNSFVFYFVPIFAEGMGYNETVVSVLLMLYSEIAVIFGDTLSDTVGKRIGDRAIYLALAINVLALTVFVINGETFGVIAALVLLGISASFGKPSQQTYYLKQEATAEYGEDRAMGLYNFSENIGESLGPIVFARLLGATPTMFMTFLAYITGSGALHYILNRKEQKNDE